MGTTNINQGVNYGALLTPAGMDRASTGELGVRGGAGAGIDPNEGFNLGFDLSYLPPFSSSEWPSYELPF